MNTLSKVYDSILRLRISDDEKNPDDEVRYIPNSYFTRPVSLESRKTWESETWGGLKKRTLSVCKKMGVTHTNESEPAFWEIMEKVAKYYNDVKAKDIYQALRQGGYTFFYGFGVHEKKMHIDVA